MSTITENGFIIIPRVFSPEWKVTITRTDGTIDDVTNDLMYCKYSLLATEGIGDFEVRVDNTDEKYGNLYTGTEIVKIYLDNSSIAVTERFRGKIEKIQKKYSNGHFQISFTGRHVSKELLEILVSKSYSNIEASVILTNLISNYLGGGSQPGPYTSANVTNSGVNITIDFVDKPFWDCVRDLCNLSNCDCYVDKDKDFHFSTRNSILNTSEVVWVGEIIDSTGLGDTTFDIRNRQRVYGVDNSGLPIVYTSDDTISQVTYGIIEGPLISDNSIKTIEEAKKRADGELVLYKEKKFQGDVIVYGFPDVNAGEKIWVSLTEQKIHSTYRILQITQEFGHDVDVGFKSSIKIEKPIKDITYVIRDAQNSISGKDKSKSLNPDQLKFSYNFPFDDSSNIENAIDCSVVDGKLILNTGKTYGIMTSVSLNTPDTITQVEINYVGNYLDQCIFEISANNGDNWTLVSKNIITDIIISKQGSSLKARITLNQSNDMTPEIESFVLLYK